MSESKPKLYVQKIKFRNFGKYYGDNEVLLSDHPKKTITIIHGTMGAGKTTIMDAMYWCLYNIDRPKPQQQVKPDEGFINKNAYKLLEVGKKDKTEVEITFADELGPKFFLTRTVEFEKKSNETTLKKNKRGLGSIPSGIELSEHISLTRRKVGKGPHDYDLPETEYSIVESYIENIFPKSLSSFFLFDAELLDKFFSKTGSNLVKEGIEIISGLPIMQKASKNFEKVKTSIQGTIASMGPEFKIAGDNVVRQTEIKNNDQKTCDDLNNELQGILEEISGIEDWMDKNGTEEVQKKRIKEKTVEIEIHDIDSKLNSINTDIKNTLTDLIPKFLLKSTLENTEKILQDLENKGEIPTPITRRALENILETSTCICGRGLHAEGKEKLEKMKETTSSSPLIRNIEGGRFMLSQCLQQTDPIKQSQDFGTLRSQRNTAGQLLSDKKREKQTILNEISSVGEKEISLNQNRLNELNNVSKPEVFRRIGSAEKDLKAAIELLDEADLAFQKLSKEKKENEKNNRKMILAKYCAKQLDQLRNELIEDLRKESEIATTKYFLDLVSRDEFSGVSITKDYETLALGPDGTSRNISAGQGHSLALSYIAAMREITKHQYFMIIDSAMHNIDAQERLEVAKGFEKYLPGTQITMLVQAQEYTGGGKEDITGAQIGSIRDILLDRKLVYREYLIKKEPAPQQGLDPIAKIELLNDFSRET